jgi:hypothetical protein
VLCLDPAAAGDTEDGDVDIVAALWGVAECLGGSKLLPATSNRKEEDVWGEWTGGGLEEEKATLLFELGAAKEEGRDGPTSFSSTEYLRASEAGDARGR